MMTSTEEIQYLHTVLDALKSDPAFQRHTRRIQSVIEQYVCNMASVLADEGILDEFLTYSMLNRARHVFWSQCVQTSYFDDIAYATSERELHGMSREEFAAVTRHKVLKNLEFAAQMSTGVSLMSRPGVPGISDQQLMLSPSTGLNIHARTLYVVRKLTVRRLLEVQPMMIFQY